MQNNVQTNKLIDRKDELHIVATLRPEVLSLRAPVPDWSNYYSALVWTAVQCSAVVHGVHFSALHCSTAL